MTKMIGLNPTKTAINCNPIPMSRWGDSAGRIEHDIIDVYELSSELICKVQPFKESIKWAKKEYDLQTVLQVVLWISMNDSIPTPAIGFELPVIQFLNSTGANIDIDTYLNG